MSELHLRAVLFQSSGMWAVQGLEHDIAAQGKTEEAARASLRRAVGSIVAIQTKDGTDPLSHFPPAPYDFFDMFTDGKELPPELEQPEWGTLEFRIFEYPAG